MHLIEKKIYSTPIDVEEVSKILIETLPEEVLAKIFARMKMNAQNRNTPLKREWKNVLIDPIKPIIKRKELLQELEEKGRFIGPSTLKRCYGMEDKFPPIPEEIFRELESPCPENIGKKKKDTHILFLMPKTIKGVPVTINTIEKLVKDPVNGFMTRFRCITEIKRVFGNRELDKTCWVLMTEDLLKKSKCKSRETLLDMVSKYGKGYQLPPMLMPIFISFTLYVDRGKILLGIDPMSFTCCQEEIRDRNVVVGGYENGLYCGPDYPGCQYVGVAPILRF